MCKSKANGGQRCYTHAVARYARAAQAYGSAQRAREAAGRAAGQVTMERASDTSPAGKAYNAALDKEVKAKDRFTQARIEYASTRRGQQDIAEQAALSQIRSDRIEQAEGHRSPSVDQQTRELADAANRGLLLRETNFLVSRGFDRDALQKTYPPSVIGKLVARERATQEKERATARSARANPAASLV